MNKACDVKLGPKPGLCSDPSPPHPGPAYRGADCHESIVSLPTKDKKAPGSVISLSLFHDLSSIL